MRIVVLALFLCAACGDGDRPKAVGPTPLEDPWKARKTAPAVFKVKFETSKGDIIATFTRAWSPEGVDRVYSMVRAGYFDGVRFYRVAYDFVAQFGIHGDPAINGAWRTYFLPDEPRHESNRKGTIVFAQMSRPNSRSNQLFINLKDNPQLDARGFTPLGEVTEGMKVVRSLHSGYGEGPSAGGRGPDQATFAVQGNAYLDQVFPKLDEIRRATVIQ
ncbi:MAG: peptidylprolyl isomerase [Planctomycetota bacterium]|nr:peptidylprolyl isomerase [Planctomycetota bacterium]